MHKNLDLQHLLNNNKDWVNERLNQDPKFFDTLSSTHAPKYLWIGCSDARVPANTIVGLSPGEVFVHRNVGNIVAHSDMNIQTVISYAVRFLKVRHIIVTGHYDCGAVKATLSGDTFEGVDNWLFHIKDVVRENDSALSNLNEQDKIDKLCELNVQTQVRHVAESSAVKEAWTNNQEISIHGWVYSVKDGLIKNLDCTVNTIDEANALEPSLLIKK